MSADDDGMAIHEVSQLLGVPAPTIRSWERRYGVAGATRTDGGHRRYSPAAVARLRVMRDEISGGRRTADAAVLVRDAAETAEPFRSLIAAFLDIVDAMDGRRLSLLLDQCRDRFGVDDTVCNVVLPAMRQIGAAWQTGRHDVGQEHVATYAAAGWLDKVVALGPAPWQRGTIVLSCGPEEGHTLGLAAFGVLLAQRGWASHMLGAYTPTLALPAAIERTGAAAAVVVSHAATTRPTTIESLHAAARAGVALFYAGNAFLTEPTRQGVPGRYLGEDLVLAAETVIAAMPTSGVASVL